MKMTSQKFNDLRESYAGYCLRCKDVTEDSGVEPDAMGYTCDACGRDTLMGIENALLMGLITVVQMPQGRKVNWKGEQLTVYEHIITKNFWEFYLCDAEVSDIRLAIVVGFETELGDVSLSEIEPHVVSRKWMTPSTDILPPPYGCWV